LKYSVKLIATTRASSTTMQLLVSVAGGKTDVHMYFL